ncbi:MAG TPA: MmcQ/YjbR family DNA-binding protein [Armatimonadota bacterium]|nr:MmcQ/YjbR family DNA-binding protein [Armatimonadota bacterium]
MADIDIARELALSLPGADEHEHWGRPSFRVRKRIFATLWPDEQHAVLMLSPDDQAALIALHPEAFSPVPGGWGARGATSVRLGQVEREELMDVLETAWRRVAPKRAKTD